MENLLESFTWLFYEQASLLAVIIMLVYTLFKSTNTNIISNLVVVIVIFFAIFLQYKGMLQKIIETKKIENRIKYIENALEENNITSKSYSKFKENEVLLNNLSTKFQKENNSSN